MDPDIVIPVPRKRRAMQFEQPAANWVLVPAQAQLNAASGNRASQQLPRPRREPQAAAVGSNPRLASLANLASDFNTKPLRRDSFGKPMNKVTNNKISRMAGKQDSLLESRKFSFEAASATGQDESISETVELERIYSVFKSGKSGSWVDDFRLLLDRLDLNETEIEEWKENHIGKNELFCTLWFEFNKRLGKSPIAPGKLGRKHTKARPGQEALPRQQVPEQRPTDNQFKKTQTQHGSLSNKNFIHVSESWSRIESNQTVEECDENNSMEMLNEKPDLGSLPPTNPDSSDQQLLGKRPLEDLEGSQEVPDPHQTLSQAICKVFQCELPYHFPSAEERTRRGSFDLLSPTDKSLKGSPRSLSRGHKKETRI